MAPAACAAGLVAGCTSMAGGSRPIGFFITSSNPGKGGNLGGLAGADAHCQRLAAGAARARSHRQRPLGQRTRPGGGHQRGRSAQPERAARQRDGADRKGEVVSGCGDAVNRHDILTGSRPDGTATLPEPGKDTSCGGWTRGEGARRSSATTTTPAPTPTRWPTARGTPRTARAARAAAACAAGAKRQRRLVLLLRRKIGAPAVRPKPFRGDRWGGLLRSLRAPPAGGRRAGR